MDVKWNFKLKNLNESTIGFYEYVLQEEFNSNFPTTVVFKGPDPNDLFQLIKNEFEELRKPPTLLRTLKILHLNIQHSTAITMEDVLNFAEDLCAKYTLKEQDMIITLQIIYRILNTLPMDMRIDKLRTLVLITRLLQTQHMASEKVQAQFALCSLLLVQKFQCENLLEVILDQILSSKLVGIAHYIDVFIKKSSVYERSKFWEYVKLLLSSDCRNDRKLGIFTVRTIINHLSNSSTDTNVDNFFYWSNESTNQLKSSWLTYLTIFENLEEKQSHLILPSLEMLKNIFLGNKTPWIRILLLQMLKHNNSLVLRWSLDYLYDDFHHLVLENQILEEFLCASNNTWLYGETSVNNMKAFTIKPSEQEHFLKVFSGIAWKSVPMHWWLLRIKTIQWSPIQCALLINIATRVRQMQNRLIRAECREIFVSIFESDIVNMALNDFMNFLDALYNNSDLFANKIMEILIAKIEHSSRPFISKKVCLIILDGYISDDNILGMMKSFEKLSSDEHGWFRIFIAFCGRSLILSEQIEFCKRHYDFDKKIRTESEAPVQKIVEYCVEKLGCDEGFNAVVREMSVDWWTESKRVIKKENVEYLLDSGGEKALYNIVRLLDEMSPELFHRIIAEIKTHPEDMPIMLQHFLKCCLRCQPHLLHKYVNEILDIDETGGCLYLYIFYTIFESNLSNSEKNQIIMRGILFGEPLNGDARLENNYGIQMLDINKPTSMYGVRRPCLRYLDLAKSDLRKDLKKDLISKSKSLSEKKPRYFENSKHHRIKLRIAQALAKLNQIDPFWDEYYLFAILHENNQTNVTYIYEFLTAFTISEGDLMKQMENLRNLSSSCQVSMFAISFLFCVIHKKDEKFTNNLIALLLPWTMGSNFNTRLYAQITIYHLLQRFQILNFEYLKVSIENSLKETPNAYEKLITDLRYNFPKDFHWLDTEPIIYVTIVPEDEVSSYELRDLEKYESLKRARQLNLSKKKISQKNSDCSEHLIEDVQRKMNPGMGLNKDCTRCAEKESADMIVVASLIDKLPNLGGIARTCEVMGIKHLVLDSVKQAQNKEFKNLSMTAENWINISEVKAKDLREYLMNKRLEGYEIVGAEQTANSKNFMHFQFPSKCVLLLGHEKEGIPADLIAFLDHAVEIPQFGMVRSLNVHVTGALFMYEYCKQHFSKAINEANGLCFGKT